jgi:ADP-dependent NAD(P)H-hydrate dehydratase
MLPSDLPTPPRRRPDTSKHDHGRVIVVGGAVGMAGAPALAAMAALRAGAGLVELVTPDVIAAVAASFDPCVMTSGLPTGAAGTFAATAAADLDQCVRRASALAVGPGMGRSDDVVALVARLWHEAACVAVFDADALWALSRLPREALRRHAGPRVVTPHAGEMARLIGHDGPARVDRGTLEVAAVDLAHHADVVVVLKGPGTLVAAPGREARNETGNPGLATAGTGDVLTGIVTALLAQGLEPFAAARLAVWLHGRSGDVAAAALGEWSLTARDVIERLHVAFLEAAGGKRSADS